MNFSIFAMKKYHFLEIFWLLFFDFELESEIPNVGKTFLVGSVYRGHRPVKENMCHRIHLSTSSHLKKICARTPSSAHFAWASARNRPEKRPCPLCLDVYNNNLDFLAL